MRRPGVPRKTLTYHAAVSEPPAPETTIVRQYRYSPPPGAASILLVRHGESAPARLNQSFELVDGHGDPELDPVGVEQAQRVAERLVGEPIAAIYISTLRRTAETAAPLAARLGISPVVEPDIREVHLGEWEAGLFRIRVREQHPIAQEMFAKERWDVIPGAEPKEQFEARVRGALNRVAARHRDHMVAVFTHGGVIGQALSLATGSRPFAFTGADNGSVSHLVIEENRWLVRTYNDVSHLGSTYTTAPEPPT